jgi:hypothetical protein
LTPRGDTHNRLLEIEGRFDFRLNPPAVRHKRPGDDQDAMHLPDPLVNLSYERQGGFRQPEQHGDRVLFREVSGRLVSPIEIAVRLDQFDECVVLRVAPGVADEQLVD